MKRGSRLTKWLRYCAQHKTKTQDFNFQSMHRNMKGGMTAWTGKYKFTDLDMFFKLFARDFAKLTHHNAISLVFRPDRSTATPFYMDLDFRSPSETRIPSELCLQITHHLLTILQQVVGSHDKWNVICSKRTGFYYKGKLGKWCGGFHILIPNLHVTVDEMKQFRVGALYNLSWYHLLSEYSIVNEPSDVLDKAVMEKCNGLVLTGLNKPKKAENTHCSPHYIFAVNSWNGEWLSQDVLPYGWQFQNPGTRTRWIHLLKLMYGWVFQHVYKRPTKKLLKAKRVEEKQGSSLNIPPAPVEEKLDDPEIIPESGEVRFNLPYFIQLVHAKDIGHSAWKQVVIFSRICNLDKATVLKSLNRFFTPRDMQENERVWNSYREEVNITEASIVYILNRCQVHYDLKQLFPDRTYRFHNEHRMFMYWIETKKS